MEREVLKELQEIKKELQDIRSILEPKEVKVLIGDNSVTSIVTGRSESSELVLTQDSVDIKVSP